MTQPGLQPPKKMYTYLLSFGRDFGPTNEVQSLLHETPAVRFWYRCLPNAIFFTSELSAPKLYRIFRNARSGRFFILDCDADYAGWMPKKSWNLIKNPHGTGEE